MSVRLVADVLDHVHGIPTGRKLLLVCLADHANDDGECWPSISTLARRMNVSNRHVSTMLKDLVEDGFLRIDEHAGKSNTYRILTTRPMNSSSGVPTNQSSGVNRGAGVNSSSGGDEPQFMTTPEPQFMTPMNSSSSRTIREPSKRTFKELSGGARAKNATGVPDDFTVSDEQYEWASTELNLGSNQVNGETAKFLDYHRAKGSTFRDWAAAWRNWMRNAIRFSASGNGRAAPAPSRAAKAKQQVDYLRQQIAEDERDDKERGAEIDRHSPHRLAAGGR